MSEDSKTFFKTKFLKSLKLALIVILVLEVFVFNYKSFVINPLNSGRYEKKKIDVSQAQVTGLQKKKGNVYVASMSEPYVIFHVKKDAKTTRLDASYAGGEKSSKELVANLEFSCVGYTDYRKNAKNFYILKSDKRTQYVTNASPDGIIDIKIKFDIEAEERINLNSLTVNEGIPFNFSIVRVLGLLILIEGLYLLFAYAKFRKPYDIKIKAQKYALTTSALIVLLSTLGVFIMFNANSSGQIGTVTESQMTRELVDAFESGHVYLNEKVPKSLLDLKNPYDWNARLRITEPLEWDHLLFEGKYYSYYGIAPVALVFLPYHMVTGKYFPSAIACIMFTLIGLLFLGMAYWAIVKKWFKKLEFRMALLGFFCVEFSTTILISLKVNNFYEIAQSAGFCFLAIGLYFMITSNVLGKEKIKISRVCLSSIFVSLAVLSRAVAILYAICMVVWAVYGFIKYKKAKTEKSTIVKYVLAFAIPYVIFGGIQMAYNIARFHNPLDFGIGHTLTIYDYTHLTQTLGTTMESIVNFLFTIPKVDSTFPFLHDNFDTLGINGFYFQATNTAIGFFAIFLPAWAYLYTPKAAKFFDRSQKIKLALCWLLPGLVMPIIAVIMTWQYGYSARYGADFAWQMCLGALMIVFFMYSRIQNLTTRKWLFRIMVFCTLWCIVGNLAYVFSDNPANVNDSLKLGGEIYSRMQNMVQFWR